MATLMLRAISKLSHRLLRRRMPPASVPRSTTTTATPLHLEKERGEGEEGHRSHLRGRLPSSKPNGFRENIRSWFVKKRSRSILANFYTTCVRAGLDGKIFYFGVSHRIYGHTFEVLKRCLITNQIIDSARKLRENLLSLTNPSLVNVCYSTILLNHGTIIRFKKLSCNLHM